MFFSADSECGMKINKGLLYIHISVYKCRLEMLYLLLHRLSFSKNIAKGMTTCEGSRCSASCIPLQACIQSNGILVN